MSLICRAPGMWCCPKKCRDPGVPPSRQPQHPSPRPLPYYALTFHTQHVGLLPGDATHPCDPSITHILPGLPSAGSQATLSRAPHRSWTTSPVALAPLRWLVHLGLAGPRFHRMMPDILLALESEQQTTPSPLRDLTAGLDKNCPHLCVDTHPGLPLDSVSRQQASPLPNDAKSQAGPCGGACGQGVSLADSGLLHLARGMRGHCSPESIAGPRCVPSGGKTPPPLLSSSQGQLFINSYCCYLIVTVLEQFPSTRVPFPISGGSLAGGLAGGTC